MRRQTGSAARFLENCQPQERREFVRRMFLNAVWYAGTKPASIVKMLDLFLRTGRTDEDRYILKHGGPVTHRLWLEAAIKTLPADARAYAAEVAAELPRGVRCEDA